MPPSEGTVMSRYSEPVCPASPLSLLQTPFCKVGPTPIGAMENPLPVQPSSLPEEKSMRSVTGGLVGAGSAGADWAGTDRSRARARFIRGLLAAARGECACRKKYGTRIGDRPPRRAEALPHPPAPS